MIQAHRILLGIFIPKSLFLGYHLCTHIWPQGCAFSWLLHQLLPQSQSIQINIFWQLKEWHWSIKHMSRIYMNDRHYLEVHFWSSPLLTSWENRRWPSAWGSAVHAGKSDETRSLCLVLPCWWWWSSGGINQCTELSFGFSSLCNSEFKTNKC